MMYYQLLAYDGSARQTDRQTDTHISVHTYIHVYEGEGERRQKQCSAVPLLTGGGPSETSKFGVNMLSDGPPT